MTILCVPDLFSRSFTWNWQCEILHRFFETGELYVGVDDIKTKVMKSTEAVRFKIKLIKGLGILKIIHLFENTQTDVWIS